MKTTKAPSTGIRHFYLKTDFVFLCFQENRTLLIWIVSAVHTKTDKATAENAANRGWSMRIYQYLPGRIIDYIRSTYHHDVVVFICPHEPKTKRPFRKSTFWRTFLKRCVQVFSVIVFTGHVCTAGRSFIHQPVHSISQQRPLTTEIPPISSGQVFYLHPGVSTLLDSTSYVEGKAN